MEMAGAGLQFLAQYYPHALDLMRRLIANGRIELISSTYAPTMWIAFPRRDLLKSIEINFRVLADLGLPKHPVFLAQEAFFGHGLRAIEGLFDSVLCKDEYINYYIGKNDSAGYKLGCLDVLIGSNHIINEIYTLSAETNERKLILSERYKKRLGNLQRGTPRSVHRSQCVKIGKDEWYWYHFGSGHHFSTCANPEQLSDFYCDPEWVGHTMDVLGRLHAEGFTFDLLSSLASALKAEDLPAMPLTVEGSWNTTTSRGTYRWLGGHAREWQDTPNILSRVWRARAEIIYCDRVVSALADEDQRAMGLQSIAALWEAQILAEVSDPHGWDPTLGEVQHGMNSADNALIRAAQLRVQAPRLESKKRPADVREAQPCAKVECPWELFGAAGWGEWVFSEDGAILDVTFDVTASECGLKFFRGMNALVYCPSADEEHPVSIPLGMLKNPVTYLPLTNGLIGLAEERFIVRENIFGQVAAAFWRDAPWISFGIVNAAIGRRYRWKFHVLRGPVEKAVERANEINCAC